MEVKSAAGGSESSLFAEDVVNMYKNFISKMGWDIKIVSYTSDFNLGRGCKSGTFKIMGDAVMKYLKWESGVHKVQRVPETEKNGRIHSSTCQVIVYTEKTFVFKDIDERDLRIDFFRSSGAGGQSVNKTESAVRLTHIPTGIVVQNQDERDQHKNKARAMAVLKQRIYNEQITAHNSEKCDERKSKMGSGNLSEKIRTYNWPDSRITDHRLGVTLFGIDKMLEGDHLDTFLEKLIEKDRLEKLNAILKKLESI